MLQKTFKFDYFMGYEVEVTKHIIYFSCIFFFFMNASFNLLLSTVSCQRPLSDWRLRLPVKILSKLIFISLEEIDMKQFTAQLQVVGKPGESTQV